MLSRPPRYVHTDLLVDVAWTRKIPLHSMGEGRGKDAELDLRTAADLTCTFLTLHPSLPFDNFNQRLTWVCRCKILSLVKQYVKHWLFGIQTVKSMVGQDAVGPSPTVQSAPHGWSVARGPGERNGSGTESRICIRCNCPKSPDLQHFSSVLVFFAPALLL